ncbi:DNA/RNA helicase domain-containing protein [Flavobacterium aquicola]|uniref:Uncharacterized protein DUF2075 n=1 Tax=Flavobacterium aquicola TaxID=1682742 RepID=A0A3E0EUX3_9FLAO|nr:DNA/RNA helicase domain-containing protein [Flavobacterium aquicola]REH00907.1 uncharacterized protein DUF2075 [Flavobacterium aquicola]
MKQVNLISLLSAYKDLSKESFSSYLTYYNINVKTSELNDLSALVNTFLSINTNVILFDEYFVGYSIPQISKEFDLLRIDDKTVVNIELKRTSTEDKILTQLIRNKYYLEFLNKEIYSFSFVSDTGILYTLDKQDKLIEVDFIELINILIQQDVKKINDINKYFDPSNYLVSPFNSTEEFIKRRYFLTSQQDDIKLKTFTQLRLPSPSIISIKGNAGTGKTLLTYDIAKEVSDTNDVLVIHCGNLNLGHRSLRDDYGWNIIGARDFASENFSKYYLIIVDEAQRMYSTQLNYLINEVKKNSNNLIFSYDGKQTLSKKEIDYNNIEKIESEITTLPFELTDKIRTNKEVASFINCLFSSKRGLVKLDYDNIEFHYFNNNNDAKFFINNLNKEYWKIINYTPDRVRTLPYEHHNIEDVFENAHSVIGQEFNNVVAVIGEHFYYKNNYLSTRNYKDNPFYHPTNMLRQIVSRTRIKLKVVIIKNQEILDRCMEILNQK